MTAATPPPPLTTQMAYPPASGADRQDPHTGGSRPPTGIARFSPVAVWVSLAAAATYILANNPVDRNPDLLGGCGWYTAFGTNGPTCGGTRMVWYLLHGDIINAARMHLVALIGTRSPLHAAPMER